MNTKFTKLAFETNLNKHELGCLHKCFQDTFHKTVISRNEFVEACRTKGVLPFFAGRLFDVFSVQAAERGIKDGMDFEVYANIVSAFSPNAPMEEKIFVCFKVFDLSDSNLITRENIEMCLRQLNIVALNDDHIRLLATRTLEQAHAVDDKISFLQFKGMFLHSPILLLLFTMETWSVMNLSLRRSFGIKLPSFFSKSRKGPSPSPSPSPATSPRGSFSEGHGPHEGFLLLRSPSLRQRFENLMKSPGASPESTSRNSTERAESSQPQSLNESALGEAIEEEEEEIIIYETGFSTLIDSSVPTTVESITLTGVDGIKKFEDIAENEESKQTSIV